MCMCVREIEGERKRERERQKEKEKDRQGERQREIEVWRHRQNSCRILAPAYLDASILAVISCVCVCVCVCVCACVFVCVCVRVREKDRESERDLAEFVTSRHRSITISRNLVNSRDDHNQSRVINVVFCCFSGSNHGPSENFSV